MSVTGGVRCWYEGRGERARYRKQVRAGRRAGGEPDDVGPAPSGYTLLPWLLMGMGSFSNLFQGETPNPWVGGLGLLTFNSLYVFVVFRAFDPRTRTAASTRGRWR